MLPRTLILVILLAFAADPSGAVRQVSASDILEAVTEGRTVIYDGVEVNGPLNLAGRTINSSFVLTNSVIKSADFSGAAFLGLASLEGSRFTGPADFSWVQFMDASSFEGASFDGGARFNAAGFGGHTIFSNASFNNASFIEAMFYEDSSFMGARFHGTADFNYTQFSGFISFGGASFDDACFSEVQFGKAADLSARFGGRSCFQMAHFADYAGFSGGDFGGPALFGGVKFMGIADFGRAHFRGPANFVLAEFGKASSFTDTVFDGDLLLGLAKFEGLAYFANCTVGGDLILKSARIYEIKAENVTFDDGSRVFLEDADIQRFKVPWSVLEGRLDYDGAAYLALVKSYRDLEWFEDADDCYYIYRLESQERKDWGWSKLMDLIAWVSCGYGVRPGYSLAWSLLTILAFSSFFHRGRGIVPSSGDAGDLSFRDALYFSTMVFISQSPISFVPQGGYRYAVVLEGILGWLLLALFLVTLGNVMIR